MSLDSKLEKIRSPRLQNQQQTAVVLKAVETTLQEQGASFTPTAYFAALLALLSQSISQGIDISNNELASAVTYLLDAVTAFTPHPILRSKFQQILTLLVVPLTHKDAEAPIVKSATGCLESLLVAQDSASWALPQSQTSPRAALAVLLNLGLDLRPKVRKRVLEALTTVLQNGPPSPSVDHPAADLCAQTALRGLSTLATAAGIAKKNRGHGEIPNDPALMHSLQLVKTVAVACHGWPSKKLESLCETLLDISRSSNEFLTLAAFEIFEVIFEGMTGTTSSAKLPRLLQVISDLTPSQNDTQLLPPWIAVVSRGYDVLAQIEPEDTFQKLPELFDMLAGYMASSSHDIRISASECLISFLANCIPESVLLEPSVYDEKVLEKVAKTTTSMLSIKYQAAWMEVFNVIGALLDTLRWRASPVLNEAVKFVGDLRSNDSFNGKKEADEVLGKAVRAIGPEAFLVLLPLNLVKPQAGQPGRAWLLPILRDYVGNTTLAHFKSEFIPLSEAMFQRVLANNGSEKTMEVKIFETLVQQIWALFPAYCDLPVDVTTSFDQSLAELIANLLYTQTELRVEICKGLQLLVDSYKAVLAVEGEEDDMLLQRRVSKVDARQNLNHLSSFAGNILAVLFNVYSQTLPQYRGYILRCINSYLSIIPAAELIETFARVTSALEESLASSQPQTQADKQKQKNDEAKMPLMSHTLMDLVVSMSIYLPRESFVTLFTIAALIIVKDDDPQLQKKAYKLIPRLAESEAGQKALQDRVDEVQKLLHSSAEKASPPCRRDRLMAIYQIIPLLPKSDLAFIPTILSEVVISCKEVNEKARTAAFDLIVLMGKTMQEGGTIISANVPLMAEDAPNVDANLEEYFKMVSAGLAGSTANVISASVTALTRCLYEFRDHLSGATLADLLSTLDLFLTSPSREIVRSVLGFVKVSIISLPAALILPRLQSLIPNLMSWSHEHKAQFKAKVKHIVERLIRRFGVDTVEKFTPEADKKLVQNIRKTRERNKRKNQRQERGSDSEEDERPRRKGKFESEYDEAIYDSSSTSEDDGAENGSISRKTGAKHRGTYIVEDEDEPLDLLSKQALANVSSTKPLRPRRVHGVQKSKAKVNIDGKLVIGMDHDQDETHGTENLSGEGGGVGAYVDAVAGKDAVQRGPKGKLKFKNQRGVDSMEVDEEVIAAPREAPPLPQGHRRGGFPRGRGWGRRGGKEGSRDFQQMRRGLGVGKTRGGRVSKVTRGR